MFSCVFRPIYKTVFTGANNSSINITEAQRNLENLSVELKCENKKMSKEIATQFGVDKRFTSNTMRKADQGKVEIEFEVGT